MSDTKWRISGGIGEPEDAAQVMTQGLGFPLRPVDGVPAQDSGDALDGILIAEGLFLQWMGPYVAGPLYPKGSLVTDADWTMVANQHSWSKPAPQPSGNPEFGLPLTPAFVEQANESVVYSGNTYEFTKSGWTKSLRVWVTELSATTHYRIVVVDVTDPNHPFSVIVNDPVLVADEWTTVALSQKIVTVGTQWIVYIDALNSGSDTAVVGGWRCDGNNNNGAPGLQGWNRRNANDVIRISKTDLDGTDRTTELLGMTVGTSVQFAETADQNRSCTYRVTSQPPVDGGDHYSYTVVLDLTGPSGFPRQGEITTMTALVPVAQSTKYAELAPGQPVQSYATTEGYLAFDGVDQGGQANAYGVDLEFEEAVINPEWDVVSFAAI